MENVKNYLKLMRVKHYLKNFLIFVPLIFSMNLFNTNLVLRTILAFIAFCLVASAIYIINDIRDIEKDKLHPIKKNRPLASGAISKKSAIILLVLLFILALIITSIYIYI